MSSAKKNTLCLKEKIELIDSYEKEKLSVKELQEKYKCGKTQIYYIIKRKDELKEMWGNGTRGDLKKRRRTENEDINNLVWEWFVNAKSQNLPLNGPLLQTQAKLIAEKLGNNSFKASNGWLESFRKRHNIIGNEICDERQTVDQECVDEWKKKIPEIIQDYRVEDIFSGAETGLYFRALPSEASPTAKEEKRANAKMCRDRLTLFLCCSLKGEKEKPLVIGKAAKPRCFENLSLSKLPVIWKSNKNALMSSEIMEEWLKDFDNEMQKQDRNVLLFLSDATCNTNIVLENVKLISLPKNTGNHIQPLHQGIIENLKIYYRKLCIQSIRPRMDNYENVNEMSQSISILDAILWISSSWSNIKETVIGSCFQKAGFPSDNIYSDTSIEDDINIIKEFIYEAFPDTCDADQFIGIDRNISTIEPVQSAEITIINPIKQSDDSDPDEEIVNKFVFKEENKIKSYEDALKAIIQIRDFSLSVNDGYLFNLMNDASSHIEKEL